MRQIIVLNISLANIANRQPDRLAMLVFDNENSLSIQLNGIFTLLEYEEIHKLLKEIEE